MSPLPQGVSNRPGDWALRRFVRGGEWAFTLRQSNLAAFEHRSALLAVGLGGPRT